MRSPAEAPGSWDCTQILADGSGNGLALFNKDSEQRVFGLLVAAELFPYGNILDFSAVFATNVTVREYLLDFCFKTAKMFPYGNIMENGLEIHTGTNRQHDP